MADKTVATAPGDDRPASPAESKRARFVRLATARTGKALSSTLLIANLAGPGYEYTAADSAAIVKALREAVGRVEDAFTKRAAPDEGGFKLPDA